ncbi:ANTAR domain-containing protein [Streptomyces sp. NBC_01283]|nr:ANTAR domain-containing protein [Streptomyces sp. NBC_01283]
MLGAGSVVLGLSLSYEGEAGGGDTSATADGITSASLPRRAKRQLCVEGRALSSRAVIDQARGMIMALAPCSSERAWGLPVDVSQHGNVRLRDVAAAPVATAQAEPNPEQT